MSAELQKVRGSEEQLRAERRVIYDRLREVSKSLNTNGHQDPRLTRIIDDMAVLLTDGGGAQHGNPGDSSGADPVPCFDHTPTRAKIGSTASSSSASSTVGSIPVKYPEVRNTSCSGSATSSQEHCGSTHEADEASGAGRPRRASSPRSARANHVKGVLAETVSSSAVRPTDDVPVAASPVGGGSFRRARTVEPAGDRQLHSQAHAAERSSSVSMRRQTSQASAWTDNARSCTICAVVFGLITRRHHCRSCGRNVCNLCSPYRVQLVSPLPHPVKGTEGAHRVCLDCHHPVDTFSYVTL